MTMAVFNTESNLGNCIVIGVGTIIISISGWSLLRGVQSIQADADLATQILLLQQEVKELRDDKEPEIRQDRTIRKHWKLHNWARNRINELERKNNLPVGEWPEFPD